MVFSSAATSGDSASCSSEISLLKLHLTSTDFHALKAETMLNRLMEMHDYYIRENDTWLSRYAWKDAYNRGKRLGTGYKKNY